MGINVVIKGYENIEKAGRPCVILCGPHQSSMDVYIGASFVPGGTTAIGKKELARIPIFNIFGGLLSLPFVDIGLFGFLFLVWLTPVVLIDRAHTGRALETLAEAGKTITEHSLRLILFPEGTVGRAAIYSHFKSIELTYFPII
jgi:1-acyl-sn-glycerol-3-phosphate acyltransferase